MAAHACLQILHSTNIMLCDEHILLIVVINDVT